MYNCIFLSEKFQCESSQCIICMDRDKDAMGKRHAQKNQSTDSDKKNTFVNTCIIVFFFQKSFSVKAANVSYAWMVTRMLWEIDMHKKPSPPIVIKVRTWPAPMKMSTEILVNITEISMKSSTLGVSLILNLVIFQSFFSEKDVKFWSRN